MRLLLFFAAATIASGQTTPKPGSVEGVVVNLATKGPAGKATVILHNSEKGFSYAAVADDAGRFRFPSVEPASSYFVTANAAGFLQDGARHARPFSVAEDQKVTGIAAPVMPGGAISGKVLDADGDPVSGAQVMLQAFGYETGKRQLQTSRMQATDDRGEYRLSSLGPGRYYVLVRARTRQQDPPGRMHRAGADLDYSPTYYPAAGEISGATPIDLDPGGETDGINFRLQKVQLYHIRGKIAGSQDLHGNRAAVFVAQCDPSEFGLFNESSNPAAAMDGTFDLPHVAPGTYCVSAQVAHESARQTVTVADRDLDLVTLTMTRGFPVKVMVAVEGPPLDSRNLGIMLTSDAMGQNIGGGQAQPDGTFELENVQPGAYSLQYGNLPPNAYIKSISLNGRDVPDGRINLTSSADTLSLIVATDVGQVTGSLRSASGDPAAGMTVVIAPAGTVLRRERMRTSISDANGNFTLAGIAPSDYEVFAFEEIDINSMSASEYRQAFESMAAAVTVHSNGHETVEVKVITADQAAEALKKLR